MYPDLDLPGFECYMYGSTVVASGRDPYWYARTVLHTCRSTTGRLNTYHYVLIYEQQVSWQTAKT